MAPIQHIEERLARAQQRIMTANKRLNNRVASSGGGTAREVKEREFERTPWYWPPYWFGYKWRRAEYASWRIGGGVDRWEYWTDKQMAHAAFKEAAGVISPGPGSPDFQITQVRVRTLP